MSGMASPPPNSAGAPNLAALLLKQLNDAAFPPNPPSSFETRLFVLYVISGLALVGAVAHMLIIILDIRRRGGREGKAWWLIRWANLPSGRYRVTNTKLISAVFSLVNLPLIIADLHNIQSTSIRRRSQVLAAAFRSLPNVPLLLHMTFLTYGQIQSYTLSGQTGRLRRKSGEPWLSDHLLNVSFLITLAAILLGVLIPAILVSVVGAQEWGEYQLLASLLAQLSANWTGGAIDPAAVARLTAYKAALDQGHHVRTGGFVAAFVFGDAVCLWLSLVNAFALALPFLIRRSEVAPVEPTVEEPHYIPAPSIRRPSTVNSFATSMEKSDLAQLAAREVSRRQEALQLADHDLIMGCSWLLLVCLTCFGLAFAIVVKVIVPDNFAGISWAFREMVLTTVHWLYSVLHLTIFPLLAHRGFVKLHSHKASNPSTGNELSQYRSARSGGGMGLIRVKVVVEETEDLKLDADAPFGRLATVIEGGRRDLEEDVEIDEEAARGGGLQNVVEWQKPEWAATLKVPERSHRPHLLRQSSSSSFSSTWRDSFDLPHLTTTLDAAIPWEWSAGPKNPPTR